MRPFAVACACVFLGAQLALVMLQSASYAQTKTGVPLRVDLNTLKTDYQASKPIVIDVVLTALEDVTVCLSPQQPESRFIVTLTRGGFGKFPKQPQVIQSAVPDKAVPEHIAMHAGQVRHIRIDLKKLVVVGPSDWQAGDYRVDAKFLWCGADENAETGIASRAPLHVFVLD